LMIKIIFMLSESVKTQTDLSDDEFNQLLEQENRY